MVSLLPYSYIDMKGRFGMATVEFEPHKKYYKLVGFGNPDAPRPDDDIRMFKNYAPDITGAKHNKYLI